MEYYLRAPDVDSVPGFTLKIPNQKSICADWDRYFYKIAWSDIDAKLTNTYNCQNFFERYKYYKFDITHYYKMLLEIPINNIILS